MYSLSPQYIRYICTCNEDLCNDDCNSCRQLCDMQDGPIKIVEEEQLQEEEVQEVKSKHQQKFPIEIGRVESIITKCYVPK